jgi:hypothetical protein
MSVFRLMETDELVETIFRDLPKICVSSDVVASLCIGRKAFDLRLTDSNIDIFMKIWRDCLVSDASFTCLVLKLYYENK